MNVSIALLAALVGYLCGSISWARVVTRIFAPQKDITRTEIEVADSGEKLVMRSVSATTVSVQIGARLGFLTVVLDVLKIVIPALIFKRVWPDTPYLLIVATTGMIGHIWPLYHGFKGGRGLSAVYAGMFAIDWIGVFATSLAGMVFGFFVLRDVLMTYMAGLWFFIPWLWFRTHDLRYLTYALAVNVIFLLAMIPDIKQYLKNKREGTGIGRSDWTQHTGMGRGLYKIGKRFGLLDDIVKDIEADDRK